MPTLGDKHCNALGRVDLVLGKNIFERLLPRLPVIALFAVHLLESEAPPGNLQLVAKFFTYVSEPTARLFDPRSGEVDKNFSLDNVFCRQVDPSAL